jgi:small ligand-binding sensory domain FIST
MRIASAISIADKPAILAAELTQQLQSQLQGAPVDVVVAFVTSRLVQEFSEVISTLQHQLFARTLLACTAESVLGVDREIEQAAAVSALAMSLPGITVKSFHLAEDEWADILRDNKALRTRLAPPTDLRLLAVLGDPFTTPVVQLLDACSEEFPAAPVVGGMASGITRPGQARLAINGNIYSSGLVGVGMAGPLQVDCVVSQGCRPVGHTMVITRAQQNVIEQLDGIPAIAAIGRMLEHLPRTDREMIEKVGLQIGRVIDERKGNFGRGDFLIRNILSLDRHQGHLTIGDMIHENQTVQFQVQDSHSADEDLRLLLQGELLLANAPTGVLMFTCNGRGTHLFGTPDHDISTVRSVLGSVPVAGFFCAGELGPVGGRNFIHGQTVSLALFR